MPKLPWFRQDADYIEGEKAARRGEAAPHPGDSSISDMYRWGYEAAIEEEERLRREREEEEEEERLREEEELEEAIEEEEERLRGECEDYDYNDVYYRDYAPAIRYQPTEAKYRPTVSAIGLVSQVVNAVLVFVCKVVFGIICAVTGLSAMFLAMAAFLLLLWLAFLYITHAPLEIPEHVRTTWFVLGGDLALTALLFVICVAAEGVLKNVGKSRLIRLIAVVIIVILVFVAAFALNDDGNFIESTWVHINRVFTNIIFVFNNLFEGIELPDITPGSGDGYETPPVVETVPPIECEPTIEPPRLTIGEWAVIRITEEPKILRCRRSPGIEGKDNSDIIATLISGIR